MTLPEIRDSVRALPDGGYLSPDTRFNDNYIDNLIHSARAAVIRADFIKFKVKRAIWYQGYTPEYSSEFQDGQLLHVKFQLPDVLYLDAKENGYGYVGVIECNKAFRVWTDRGVFAAAVNDRIMNPQSGRTTNILFEGSNYGEIYSKVLITEMPRFVNIYSIPTDVPTYNILTDEYPLGEGLIKDLCNVITKSDLIIITKSFVDRVNQGRIDNAPPIPQRP